MEGRGPLGVRRGQDERLSHQGLFDGLSVRAPVKMPELGGQERARSIAEIEATLTEEQARADAARCLDCGICSQCHECVSACPAGAIRFDMRPEEMTLRVRTAMLATGFKLFDRACYGLHPVAQPVIGSRRNIERFGRDDLVRYVERQYTAANVIVGAAGAIDPAAIGRAAEAA